MSDLEKLLSDCNNLKMLRNQVTMDGREIEKRKAIINSWHTEKTWIKAYNEFRSLQDSTPNAAIRELISKYDLFDEHCYRCGDTRQSDLIEDLNKLLTGDK